MLVENQALKLAEKTNYLNKEIPYLKNIRIVEYDIESAGFSVIKFLKLLPEEEIKALESLEKYERNVRIGIKIRNNKNIGEKIQSTLEKVRKAFVLLNRIEPENILSIKKDALFIIRQTPENLVIKDFFKFRKKNTYSSYALLNGKEFYYDSFHNKVDIKGLGEIGDQESVAKNIIKKIFEQAEKQTPENMFNIYRNFSKKYLEKRLPLESYRELDNGKFRYKEYLINECPEEFISDLDISQNYLKYILPLLEEII